MSLKHYFQHCQETLDGYPQWYARYCGEDEEENKALTYINAFYSSSTELTTESLYLTKNNQNLYTLTAEVKNTENKILSLSETRNPATPWTQSINTLESWPDKKDATPSLKIPNTRTIDKKTPSKWKNLRGIYIHLVYPRKLINHFDRDLKESFKYSVMNTPVEVGIHDGNFIFLYELQGTPHAFSTFGQSWKPVYEHTADGRAWLHIQNQSRQRSSYSIELGEGDWSIFEELYNKFTELTFSKFMLPEAVEVCKIENKEDYIYFTLVDHKNTEAELSLKIQKDTLDIHKKKQGCAFQPLQLADKVKKWLHGLVLNAMAIGQQEPLIALIKENNTMSLRSILSHKIIKLDFLVKSKKDTNSFTYSEEGESPFLSFASTGKTRYKLEAQQKLNILHSFAEQRVKSGLSHTSQFIFLEIGPGNAVSQKKEEATVANVEVKTIDLKTSWKKILKGKHESLVYIKEGKVLKGGQLPQKEAADKLNSILDEYIMFRKCADPFVKVADFLYKRAPEGAASAGAELTSTNPGDIFYVEMPALQDELHEMCEAESDPSTIVKILRASMPQILKMLQKLSTKGFLWWDCKPANIMRSVDHSKGVSGWFFIDASPDLLVQCTTPDGQVGQSPVYWFNVFYMCLQFYGNINTQDAEPNDPKKGATHFGLFSTCENTEAKIIGIREANLLLRETFEKMCKESSQDSQGCLTGIRGITNALTLDFYGDGTPITPFQTLQRIYTETVMSQSLTSDEGIELFHALWTNQKILQTRQATGKRKNKKNDQKNVWMGRADLLAACLYGKARAKTMHMPEINSVMTDLLPVTGSKKLNKDDKLRLIKQELALWNKVAS